MSKLVNKIASSNMENKIDIFVKNPTLPNLQNVRNAKGELLELKDNSWQRPSYLDFDNKHFIKLYNDSFELFAVGMYTKRLVDE